LRLISFFLYLRNGRISIFLVLVMSNIKYTPETRKAQMPKRMTAKEGAQLAAAEFSLPTFTTQ
jgi:hypothetical protein